LWKELVKKLNVFLEILKTDSNFSISLDLAKDCTVSHTPIETEKMYLLGLIEKVFTQIQKSQRLNEIMCGRVDKQLEVFIYGFG